MISCTTRWTETQWKCDCHQEFKKWTDVTLTTNKNERMKKCSEAMQTLHAGCSKAEPKNFRPPQIPFPGAREGQNLISSRWSLPLPTDPVLWRSMYHFWVIVVTDPQTNKQTHTQKTGPITIQCAANLSAQCKDVCDIFGKAKRQYLT